uniref:ARID domain-containing protein n=1 Tax=Trichobilharzia regenti TaxID=157069 RepID=A0AA85JKH9_TRIRE|nr:unnamed protein product [Trichobilharzia regenti]
MINSCSNLNPVTDATEKMNLLSRNISTSHKSFSRQLKSLKNVDNPNLSSRCSEDGSNVKEENEEGEEEDIEYQEDSANRSHDDSIEDDSEDNNNNNNNNGETVGDNSFFLMEQDSLSQHYSTSALSSLASSDTFGSCISPTMLAAAAMAALTSGCFPGPCNMSNQFNPLLAATKPYGFPSYPSNLNLPANSQRTQLTKQQQTTPFTHSSLNRNSKMSHNINNSVSQQSNLSTTNTMNLSSLSSHSPIHSVHNNNKSLQDDVIGRDYSTNFSHNDTTTNNSSSMNSNPTPPPPLSRSNSPTHQSNRLMTTSNDLAYMSMDDGDEENDDDMGSEEIEEDMEAENPNPQSGNHQWTFEEQFKQLYVISDDPKRKEFLDELFVYMQKRGTPVNRIPIMAKQVLDLYELFQLVVARGLNLPSSITSAAFTLRTQYMKYLYPYECETLGLSSPSELQAAIDGNRREARRSSYSFDYPTVTVPNVGSRSVSPSSTTNPQTTTSNTTTNAESALNVAAASLSSTSVYLNSLAGSNVTTSGVNQILPSISGSSTPFCANSLGFNSPFGQFNPFLPIPPGTLPAAGSGAVGGGSGLSIPSPSTLPSSSSSSSQIGNTPVNLFPPGFLPPIASGAGFPMIASSFQGFNPATANNSDDSLITSSHQTLGNPSGGILPGGANSFTDPSAMAAAAAAAATLFGAGFPTIPPAFPMTSQQQQHQSTTAFPVQNSFMNTDGGMKFPNMSMRTQSNNSCDIHENNPSRGVNLKNKLSLQDPDDCQFSSSLPLNLTANDNSINSNIMKLDEKGAAYSNNDRRTPLIEMDHDNLTKIQCDPENASLKLHSTDGYNEKDDENELSDSMGTLKNFSYHHHHHHHQNEDGENYDDNSMNTDRLFDGETEHSELRCKPDLLLGGVNKHEVIGNNNNNVRLSQSGLSFENEESNMKTAAQMACQQLWVAAAAAAAGLHCGGGGGSSSSMKTPETTNFTSLSSSINGPMTKSNFHAPNSHHQSSTESSTNNSSTHTHNHNSNSSNKSLQHHSSPYSRSTGKKSHSRTPNSLDLPSSKISKPSFANNNTNNNSNETGGKSYSSTSSTNVSSKKSQNSISDLRRSTDAITLSTSFSNTLGLNNNNGNNNNNSNSNSSFAAAQAAIATAQNLRIQTQPGAPMGLPQNAMVVTMEMGNILYQGVLFGQIKR